jgi:dihydroorotase
LYSLLIHNATIAHPDGNTYSSDVACAAGKIVRIDKNILAPAEEVIDAAGQLLLPGVVDAQVHFREPGEEHEEDLSSGSRAAARGGVTSFLEMSDSDPATTNRQALNDKLTRAAQKSVVNYGFFIGATADNLEELNSGTSTCGIKIFMGASSKSLQIHRMQDMERIFAQGTRLIAVHAEDQARIQARTPQFAQRTDAAAHSELRDNECALIATRLALSLAKKYRRRLHILHVSTQEQVALLRQDKPAWVTADATPHHLLLDINDYAGQGARVQTDPPIRNVVDKTALWAGLGDGIIDFIASDHAPHSLDEKNLGYPNAPSGIPGVETSLPLMLTEMHAGRCNLADIQKWMCYGPAQAYAIANKGKILVGWDADLTLVDMDNLQPVRHADTYTKAKWSPYDGRALRGWPVFTIVGGEIVFDHGRNRPGVLGKPLLFTQ